MDTSQIDVETLQPGGLTLEDRTKMVTYLLLRAGVPGSLVWGRSDKSKLLQAQVHLTLERIEPTIAAAAKRAGFSRGTVASWRHRDPEFRQATDDQMTMWNIEPSSIPDEVLDSLDDDDPQKIEELRQIVEEGAGATPWLLERLGPAVADWMGLVS